MNVDELEIGSELYKNALDLRYELFFQKHDLSRDILIDEHESASRHIAIVSNGSLIAYGRLSNIDKGTYQLSQIVVKPQEQGKGYGTIILKKLVELAKRNGSKKIILNARTTATQMYKKQGFISNGKEFLSKNTGVPHVQMLYTQNRTLCFNKLKEKIVKMKIDENIFANEWLESWNSHDLDKILSHYSDDLEITTPMIKIALGVDTGTLSGKQNVGKYWAAALKKMPDLRFELREVTTSVNSIALYYKSVIEKMAIEVMFFNDQGKVNKVIAHYTN